MIDSHCHINDRAFLNREEEYINDATKVGVNTFLVVGCDLARSKKAVEVAGKYKGCF